MGCSWSTHSAPILRRCGSNDMPRQQPSTGATRAKCITPTTIDAVIAAAALEHKASVFTLDQDFSRIARITRLALYSF